MSYDELFQKDVDTVRTEVINFASGATLVELLCLQELIKAWQPD